MQLHEAHLSSSPSEVSVNTDKRAVRVHIMCLSVSSNGFTNKFVLKVWTSGKYTYVSMAFRSLENLHVLYSKLFSRGKFAQSFTDFLESPIEKHTFWG